MTEYLNIDELSARIKFSKQSIYNLIHKKVLVLQIHYFKPTPKKLLFSWAAIQDWIEKIPSDNAADMASNTPLPLTTERTNSTINI